MMKLNQLFLKFKIIPFPIWILTLFIYFVPFLLDSADGDSELIWFVYIIPAFIFSYYLGVWGGLSSAFISFLTELFWELILEHHHSHDFNHKNYFFVLVAASISFGIALTIGLLTNKIKKINLELIKAEKTQIVSHLAASFGHEVRNPISVTRGFLQLLLEKELDSDKRLEYAKTALYELDHAEAIIQSYLTFAKPHFEKKERFGLKEEIQKVVEIILPMANMNSVFLELVFPPETVKKYSLEGNRNHLHQCLLNILKNSIEAMSKGGILKVEIVSLKEIVAVRISDTGDGMTKDQIRRLGEPYFSSKEKGTGLGMMVVYSIMKAMNGKIKVESEIGKGTTFTLLFPVASYTVIEKGVI
ncbi:MAG: ATP-binding protein [Bacillota bacterium]|nr:ATP-binding protein [Bacillota bacterium]